MTLAREWAIIKAKLKHVVNSDGSMTENDRDEVERDQM